MKLASILASLAVALTASAQASQQMPEKCPSVAALKSAAFQRLSVLPNAGQWLVIGARDNKYDTNTDWSFIIAVSRYNANTTEEAFQLARKSLNSLSFISGPDYFEGLSAFGCQYATVEPDVTILTVTNLDILGG